MCLHRPERKYINTPVDYMERAKGCPFRNQLLALWLCIKFTNGDSAYHPSVAGIMRDFGCSHNTAKHLYEHVTQVKCGLFRYNPATNTLVATTWKLNPMEKSVSYAPNKKALMKYCAKVYKPRYMTIRSTIKAMQTALAKVAISDKQRSDKFLLEETKFSSCSDRADALNQRKLGRIVGCHRSTISRLMKQMERDGEVTITRHPLVAVVDLRHEEWLVSNEDVILYRLDKRKIIPIGDKGYVRDANEYRLTNFGSKRDVRNVIFNHGTMINFDPRNVAKRSKNYKSVVADVDDFYSRNPQFD